MDSVNFIFLIRHLSDLKHLRLGQWISIIGAGLTAFGCAMAADPNHIEVAAGAAGGTVLVAIVHILQPSPILANEVKAEIKRASDESAKTDAAGRYHL